MLAGYIEDEIGRLRKKSPTIPCYAVVTDLCASGGYYVAVAADKISTDKASLVGSISVRMSGLTTLGFVDSLKKRGVERRMLAAGDKAMLDPFSPLKPGEVEHVAAAGEHPPAVYPRGASGAACPAQRRPPYLVKRAVLDRRRGAEAGAGRPPCQQQHVAREVIGAERIVDGTQRPSPLERLTDRLGVVRAKALAAVAIRHFAESASTAIPRQSGKNCR